MAFCRNCGNQVSDIAPACPQCGQPTGAVAVGAAPGLPGGVKRTEGTAIASLILGILGVMGCPIIPSVIALILGQQAKQKLRDDPTLDGEGLAKAGIILGWIGIGLGVLVIVGIIAAIVAGVTLENVDGIDALRRLG